MLVRFSARPALSELRVLQAFPGTRSSGAIEALRDSRCSFRRQKKHAADVTSKQGASSADHRITQRKFEAFILTLSRAFKCPNALNQGAFGGGAQ